MSNDRRYCDKGYRNTEKRYSGAERDESGKAIERGKAGADALSKEN